MGTKMWMERTIDLDLTIHNNQSHITCKLDPNKRKYFILSWKLVNVKNWCTKGASGKCWQKLTRGEGGVQEPLILAEVLREQPLIPNAGSEENKGRKIDEGKWERQTIAGVLARHSHSLSVLRKTYIKGGKVILTQQEYTVSDGHHYNLKNLAVKNKDGL